MTSVAHWSDGGPTELPDLVLRCGTHHRFVHDRGWTIATDGHGRFAFAAPDLEAMPVTQPLPGGVRLMEDADRWVPWEWSPFTGCQDDQGGYATD